MADSHSNLTGPGDDMDEDEALRYAIALSLQDQNSSQSTADADAGPESGGSKPVSAPGPISPGSSDAVSFGGLSLDRKMMEEERLKRLAKRSRPSSDDDAVEIPPPKRLAPSGVHAKAIQSSTTTLPFPSGVVKRTWALGYPRTAEDIKIEEVLQKDKLQLALISSFQWDDEWMMSKIDLAKTKLLLAAFAAHGNQKQAMTANAPRGVKFCFPPMNGPGSMHSKLQLLKFPDYLRVVIPTGNMVPYDWGETGVMENMVFLIDLPRLSTCADHKPTMFSTELSRFLIAMGVDEAMHTSLANYDFAMTKDLSFVYSIPGGHTGDALKRIGYCGLSSSVAALGLSTQDPVEVDLVCASLGSVNYELVGAIYNACRGDDGRASFKARAGRTSNMKQEAFEWQESLKERFRIYFPREETVVRSRGGRSAGGTICVQQKWWHASTFPRELVRDCVNTRDRLLMHSKMIFVRKRSFYEDANVGQQSLGWAYVGSANLSESAWGKLVKERGTGNAKINCRNWECGIIVRVSKTSGQKDAEGMEVFRDTVPVPMQVPGSKYAPQEEPWFFVRP